MYSCVKGSSLDVSKYGSAFLCKSRLKWRREDRGKYNQEEERNEGGRGHALLFIPISTLSSSADAEPS